MKKAGIKLPPPCALCRPTGGIGRLERRGDVEGVGPCDCERAEALRALHQNRKPKPKAARYEPRYDGGAAAARNDE